MSEPPDEAPSLPTVDLADLVHHDRAVRAGAGQRLEAGFGEYGAVYVENHGVDFELRDRVLDRFGSLVRQPRELKEQLVGDGTWFQRGWAPQRAGASALVERFLAAPLPPDPSCRVEHPELHADNLWPSRGGPDFARDYVALGQQLHEAGLSILQGVTMALDLSNRLFDRRLEGGPHVLRMLRYASSGSASLEEGARWAEARACSSLLTLLPGGRLAGPDGADGRAPDEPAGLHLRTREGHALRVEAPAGCIVAWVGQPLEILTGGAMRGPLLSVTAPRAPGVEWLIGAHDLHLHSRELVTPLERFRTAEAVAAYAPPALAGTYYVKTLVDLGLAPPDALDRLGYRDPTGPGRDLDEPRGD